MEELIITGISKLVNINKLYKWLGWDGLGRRRFILFYIMKNSLTPKYLRGLLQKQYDQHHGYQNRNSNDYVITDVEVLTISTVLFPPLFTPRTVMLKLLISRSEQRLYEFRFVWIQKYVDEKRGTIRNHWNADSLLEDFSDKHQERKHCLVIIQYCFYCLLFST